VPGRELKELRRLGRRELQQTLSQLQRGGGPLSGLLRQQLVDERGEV
jgi:hypothetical protein